MSRTIDERIVQMTFENQEFEARAKQTTNTLGKLTELLQFKGCEAGMEGLQRSANALDFSPIRMAAEQAGKGFNALEEIAVGCFRRIGEAIGSYVVGGLKQVTDLANSLTFAQLGQGFKKYDDLTSSVQTLVNSTGKSVDEIDAYLKRLMWYSDETSFGFTDMTKALGTMVSAGGDIDELIPMLMGVGNATAYAGKTATEFTRVIYNLNQSYSQGFLNTMDWRSIELAGVDSKVLKEQLMGAAVELNKINKSQAKLENFRNLLSDKVFTREVMQKAFGSFAEMTLEAEKLVSEGKFDTAAEAIESLSGKYEEFAERAFKSAQEAKSFNEALEATKDAVSSGWMQTWQTIFGNYDESKALWTDVTETFWELFASGAASRNNILQAWKNTWKNLVENPDNYEISFSQLQEDFPYLTQTQALVDALSRSILKIRDDLKAIFNSVFVLPTIVDETGKGILDYQKIGKKIFDIIEDIRGALNSFANEGNQMDWVIAIHNGFRAVLEVLKTVIEYGKVFVSDFVKPLSEKLKPILEDIVTIFNNLFKAVTNTARAAREDMTPFQRFLEGILKILDPVIELLGKFVQWIADLTGNVEKISVFDSIINGIANVVGFIGDVVSGAGGVLTKLADMFKNAFGIIGDAITGFLQANGADMAKLAEGGFLAYLGFGLSTIIKNIKDGKITLGGGGITGILKSVSDGIESFFKTVTDSIKGFVENEKMIKTLDAVSKAILTLAGAMLIMSFVPGEKIASSLGAIMMVVSEAMASIAILNKIEGGGNVKAAGTLNAIAFAIVQLSVALKIMSTINGEQMTTALIGFGAVLLGIFSFIAALNDVTKSGTEVKMATIGATLQAIGLALIEISIALKIVSTINLEQIGTSLLALGGALVEIFAFLAIMSSLKAVDPTKLVTIGAAMIPMGVGLIAIAAAMRILAGIDARKVDTALVALFGALGTIGLIAGLIATIGGGAASFIAIAAGFMIFAVAINAIVLALTALSALGMDKATEAIGSLASAMATIGAIGAVMGLIAVPFAAFSATLLLFAAALYAVSKAMIVAVAAFGAFSLVSSDFVGTIVDVMVAGFTAMIALIPSFVLGIVQAIIQCSGQLIDMVGTLIHIVLDALVVQMPYILDSIITIVIEILKGLNQAIGQWAPLLFDLLATIIEEAVKGLIQLVDTLAKGVLDFLIAVINNLATLVNDTSGPLGMAIGALAAALIGALIGGLGAAIGTFVSGIAEKVGEGINWLTSLFSGGQEGEESTDQTAGNDILNKLVTEEEAQQRGVNVSKALGQGIKDNKKELLATVDTVGTEMTDKMNREEDAKKAAEYTANGFIDKIIAMLEDFRAAGVAAGEAFMDGFASSGALDYASPSKATARAATYVVAGFVNTIKDSVPQIMRAGTGMGSEFMEALAESIQITDDLLNTDLNPVISPVLDLSDVRSGSATISQLLGDTAAFDATLGVNSTKLAAAANAVASQNQNSGINNSTVNINVNFTVDQAGGQITEADISHWGKQIANVVNRELGLQI